MGKKSKDKNVKKEEKPKKEEAVKSTINVQAARKNGADVWGGREKRGGASTRTVLSCAACLLVHIRAIGNVAG